MKIDDIDALINNMRQETDTEQAVIDSYRAETGSTLDPRDFDDGAIEGQDLIETLDDLNGPGGYQDDREPIEPASSRPIEGTPRMEPSHDWAGSARRLVQFLSKGVKMVGKRIYPRFMLTAEHRATQAEVMPTIQALPPDRRETKLTSLAHDRPEVSSWLAAATACHEATQKLEFAPDEIELIADPLSRYLQEANIKMGAGSELLIAVLVVMVPRIEPIIPGYADRLMSIINPGGN